MVKLLELVGLLSTYLLSSFGALVMWGSYEIFLLFNFDRNNFQLITYGIIARNALKTAHQHPARLNTRLHLKVSSTSLYFWALKGQQRLRVVIRFNVINCWVHVLAVQAKKKKRIKYGDLWGTTRVDNFIWFLIVTEDDRWTVMETAVHKA